MHLVGWFIKLEVTVLFQKLRAFRYRKRLQNNADVDTSFDCFNTCTVHILLLLLQPKNAQLYRVIHKSVKHLKNSQQIDYATDRGSSYVDREKLSKFFLRKSPRT